MSNFSNSTRRLSRMAVMAALYTVLAMITIPIGNIHLTLASLPVVLTASLFGPLQGAAVAVVGEFIHQMLTYGFTLTTLLWLVPPALRAAVIGLGVYALKKAGRLPEAKPAFYYALCVAAAILTTAVNTLVIWLDSILYGYYTAAYVFGDALARFVTGTLTAVIVATLSLVLLRFLRRQPFLQKEL